MWFKGEKINYLRVAGEVIDEDQLASQEEEKKTSEDTTKNSDSETIKFFKSLSQSKVQEVVIFVGGQGSGKSTFWRNYFSDYKRINNDSLNAKKGQKRLKEILESTIHSVVIDNCSTSIKARSEWISIA